ncbi:unnamed protein product [Bathycoccus prasinos]
MKVDDGRVFFFSARETNDATGERFAFLLLYLKYENSKEKGMKVVSLFSGIGGIDLGLVNAGHEIILQVENNPHCIQLHFKVFLKKQISSWQVSLVKTYQLRIRIEQGLKRDYALVLFHMFFVYSEARRCHGSFLKMYPGYLIGIGIRLPHNNLSSNSSITVGRIESSTWHHLEFLIVVRVFLLLLQFMEIQGIYYCPRTSIAKDSAQICFQVNLMNVTLARVNNPVLTQIL